MIIQCPSCKSRFSVDASKIKSPLTMGRCSVCGHVFTLLDHATNEIEAAEIRDRLEAERAERAREPLGDVTGMYYKPPKKEGFEEENAEKAEEEAAVFLQPEGDLRVAEAGGEQLEKEEMGAGQEGGLSEIEKEFIAGKDDFTPWEEEVAGEERGGERVEEKLETEEREEEEGIEAALETTGYGEIEHEEEFDTKETGEAGEVAEWPPPGNILEEELEEPSFEGNELKGGEGGISEEDISEPDKGIVAGESLSSLYEEKRRSPALTILIVILIVLVFGGGGWYLYKPGMYGGFTKMITGKIDAIRGRSDLVLFDLKNEQEPASDGKFFAVRGFVQNKRETPFPYVALRINIFDGKNNIILTKQTVAGRVLKAEEISKMTVHDAVKQYSAMIDMNKKSSGKLGPNQKLPFLFLFDLSKFPRDKAKTFQVEILKPSN